MKRVLTLMLSFAILIFALGWFFKLLLEQAAVR